MFLTVCSNPLAEVSLSVFMGEVFGMKQPKPTKDKTRHCGCDGPFNETTSRLLFYLLATSMLAFPCVSSSVSKDTCCTLAQLDTATADTEAFSEAKCTPEEGHFRFRTTPVGAIVTL